ncbi:SurA N-terminal domain containing protein [Candidatus Nanopelagicaceae bacterium]
MKKILTALALISAFTLTACGQVDTAASFGDTKITQAQAQSVIDEILAERDKTDITQMQLESGNALNRSQLRFTIVTSIFDEIAKELKIKVSSTEIENTRTGIYEQIGGEEQLQMNLVAAQIAPSNFERYMRATIISNKLAGALGMAGVAEADVQSKISELVQKKAKQMKVSVNPRYGRWDEATAELIPEDSAGDAVLPSSN